MLCQWFATLTPRLRKPQWMMSRSQAYEKIRMEGFEATMRGICSESVAESTRDESPMVYKPTSQIIANTGETVTIDTIIRPIFNFKAM